MLPMHRHPSPVALEPLDAVVPLRTLASGKARLGGALDAEEREELVLGMLRRTLDVLDRWPACRRVHVVSPDRSLLATLDRGQVDAVEQRGEGLNEGLRLGIDAARAAGASAALILPADLPHVTVASLERLLEAADAALAAGAGRPVVVVAPSDARGGTNALLLAPADIVAPAFGTASFEAHVRAAAAADASVQVVTDAGLGFDLDTPEDLELVAPADLAALMRLGRRSPVPGGAAV
jgi:2-phospho-L-lactate guanylyltransferase